MSGTPLCCLGGLPPAHWVPDAHALSCGACGSAFGLMLRRHHCRCCGGVFCDSCSSRRTAVPGWGFEDEVRVCDECHTLERKQMPMLLAGNVFVKPGDWTGSRNKRFVRLSHDQSALVWSPWRDDEGADEENLKTADIRKVMCVSLNKSNRSMVITLTPHATRNK